ncbi:uncharacterized protein LOC108669454 [Hyalella azteca]|uniref:Uncharacterized protein LOC108669454 n=1 Tax=Hyalella azteca TaxID=294128 RepID=A0A8B7NF79_HYAAZ|nr:uncharacterized protein LOC108669454 [Hyalella azteca]
MELRLASILLIWMMLVGTRASCVPTCKDSTVNITEGSRVPNPANCFEFYVCSDPLGGNNLTLSPEPIKCPNGTYFDVSSSKCKTIPSDGSAYCENLCDPCDLKCEAPGTLIPDPYACDSYYICLANNESIISNCGDDQSFDYIQGSCVATSDAVCYKSCDPCKVYCVHEGKVPNPFDCEGYIYCEPPYGQTEFKCPPDHQYEIGSQKCVPYGDPNQTCDNTCTDDLTTTSVTSTTTETSPTTTADQQ